MVVQGRRYAKTFKNVTQAKKWAAEEEHRASIGAWSDPQAGNLPFWHWAELWQSSRIAEKTTIATDNSRLRIHVIPRWGDVPVSTITHLHVQAWVRQLASPTSEEFRLADGRRVKGGGLSAHSAKGCLKIVHSVLGVALKAEAIRRNPAAQVQTPTLTRNEKRILTREEADRFIEATQERWRTMILVGFYTGLRWGELIGLRVRDVDLLHREIRVRQVISEVGGRLEVKPYPKSESGHREVPLTKRVADALSDHLEGHTGGPGALVFVGSRGTSPRRGDFARSVWEPAVVAAGLTDEPKLKRHDMRHTYLTWLANAGVPITIVQRRAGHASLTTTQQYLHASATEDDLVLNALDGEQVGARRHLEVVAEETDAN